jgi:hypothetical protein
VPVFFVPARAEISPHFLRGSRCVVAPGSPHSRGLKALSIRRKSLCHHPVSAICETEFGERFSFVLFVSFVVIRFSNRSRIDHREEHEGHEDKDLKISP